MYPHYVMTSCEFGDYVLGSRKREAACVFVSARPVSCSAAARQGSAVVVRYEQTVVYESAMFDGLYKIIRVIIVVVFKVKRDGWLSTKVSWQHMDFRMPPPLIFNLKTRMQQTVVPKFQQLLGKMFYES